MLSSAVVRVIVMFACVAAAYSAPVRLRCDYPDNPIGIDSAAPREE